MGRRGHTVANGTQDQGGNPGFEASLTSLITPVDHAKSFLHSVGFYFPSGTRTLFFLAQYLNLLD